MNDEDSSVASYETAVETDSSDNRTRSPGAVEQIFAYATNKINNITYSLNPKNYDPKWIKLQKKYFSRAVELIPGVSDVQYLRDAKAFAERRENAFIERSQRKFLLMGVIAIIPALVPLLPFASVIVGGEN